MYHPFVFLVLFISFIRFRFFLFSPPYSIFFFRFDLFSSYFPIFYFLLSFSYYCFSVILFSLNWRKAQRINYLRILIDFLSVFNKYCLNIHFYIFFSAMALTISDTSIYLALKISNFHCFILREKHYIEMFRIFY